MNIIKRELRSNMKGLIIWGISISVFVWLATSEFAAYYNNPEMADILDNMPKEMLKAFSLVGSNLTTVIGYISMTAVYYCLMLGIYSAILGSGILAKEERGKTSEFFMVLPISRTKAIVSKLIASIILSVAINLILVAVIYITTIPYQRGEDFDKFIFLIMFGTFIVQMIFLSVGMLFSAIMKRYKLSGWYTMGLLFGTYILSILSGLIDKLENLKYFTPFKYFEANVIADKLKLEPVYLIISIFIISLSLIGVLWFYPKRDLRI